MGNQLQVMKLTRYPNFKQNSVILITGGSFGIGRELAIQYAQRKCRIYLGARSQKKLEEVCKICEELGSQANFSICDVSKQDQCKKLIDDCIKTYGELDILYLNAGVAAHQKFDNINDLSIFQTVMQTNFFGYLYCTKYAIDHLRKNDGQIVVISSISGEIGLPQRTVYCSSKFAVTGFFEALRIEQENDKLAITIVCPPSVKTSLRDHALLKVMDEQQQSEKGNKSDIKIDAKDDRISVEDCVKIIMEAVDRRARKIYFPLKPYLLVYIRPFFPDSMDYFLKKNAKL